MLLQTNAQFLTNPEYISYVSTKSQQPQGKKPPKHVPEYHPYPQFFKYYNSPLKNGHLYPNISTTFIKYYEQPFKNQSTLLNNIERKARMAGQKIPTRWE